MPDSKHALFLASIHIHQWKKNKNMTVNKGHLKRNKFCLRRVTPPSLTNYVSGRKHLPRRSTVQTAAVSPALNATS